MCALRGRASIEVGRLGFALFGDFVHRARVELERRRGQRKVMKARWFFPGLVAFVGVSPALAQPTGHLTLSWSAPPGCATTEDVQARVDALLGTASASSVADVRASGQVERTDTGFRLLLSMAV